MIQSIDLNEVRNVCLGLLKQDFGDFFMTNRWWGPFCGMTRSGTFPERFRNVTERLAPHFGIVRATCGAQALQSIKTLVSFEF